MIHFDEVTSLAQVAPTVVLIAAVVVFPLLFFVAAPYGRFTRAGWGPTMPARWGWVLMESPSVFLFAWLWWQNPGFGDALVTTLGVAWLLHYLQRTFVFPALMRGGNRPNAMLTVLLAICFNVLNAAGNASALTARPVDLAFVAGLTLFGLGLALNLHSDAVLRGLRRPGQTGYAIPRRGAFRWVSSPNYGGELLEWLGFAIAAQTLAGWAFAAFTFANLAPRAWSNHRWYRARFPDYPPERRALVPFLW